MIAILIRPVDPGARVKKIVCSTLENFLGVVVPQEAEYWINHQQVTRQEAEDHLRIKANSGS